MSEAVRMTKQGVRDLDFGVKRKAAPESKKADRDVDVLDGSIDDVGGPIPLDEPEKSAGS